MYSSLSDVLDAIAAGVSQINVNGLWGSSGSYLLAQIQSARKGRTSLVITATPERAEKLINDIKFFCGLNNNTNSPSPQPLTAAFPLPLGEREIRVGSFFRYQISLFPAPDVLPYTQLSPDLRLWAGRINLLYELAHGAGNLVVAPIEACLRLLPPKIFVANCARVININENIDRDEFILWLSEIGYADVGLVEDVGEFSVRGGIIDVWSSTLEKPARLELEGDKIISMRLFDPATQRSKEDIRQFTVIPVRDLTWGGESERIATQEISKLADELDLPSGERRRMLENIKEHIAFSGIETFMPLFHGAVANLTDYLPDDALIIYEDPASIAASADKLAKSILDLSKHTTSIEKIVPFDRLYLSHDYWNLKTTRFKNLFLNALTLSTLDSKPASLTVETSGNADLKTKMDRSLNEEDPLKPVVVYLRAKLSKGENIIFTCHNKLQADRLAGLFKGHGLSINIMIAELSSGFCWPSAGLTIITDEELFGSKVVRRPTSRSPIDHFTSFSELVEGDYLVHEQHGIGRYIGLKNLTIDGINNDFILMEYLGGDKLYLPVYRLNLIGRYIGPNDDVPFLDRLGAVRWQNVQKKARQDIVAIAKELLRIYASREVTPGFQFPTADASYEEFAAEFPYDETPDQNKAIEDILHDMEIEKPMDRLICGDVGYGKTEVAIRAAFKAAMAGKQVAVLVPTTLLAFQHYENFTARFKNTPLKIEMLSRFRSSKEKKAIIEELARGTIDIVIGTHSLLQKNILFRDLGLLIIDEEQHFGVVHKERIKQLRSNIDCLTLTATPIPRTLHLSLTGIRDISVIDTPPVDRLSISTEIVPFDDGIIRHAVLEELSRSGQVFFVHNRVETIRSMEDHLKKLIPEASVGVAHGQMREHELEKIMMRFVKKEVNLLITTSIIEAGLDIPSANTIIVNRADTFGLSQLYQIRGRIGRSNVRGFAYLLIPSDGVISAVAKKRLTVLQRFTELGSGFQIAMHDLEIRGSGNILGRAQSGHVAAIGYEMYTKLLAKEIKKLQGKYVEEDIDPELNLQISAYLPESFIKEASVRLDLYHRLATRETLEEVSEMKLEIEDRFGSMPDEAIYLLGIMEIKVMAKKLKVQQLAFDGRTFSCRLDKSNKIDVVKIARLIETDTSHYLLRPPDKILHVMSKELERPEDVIVEAKNFLSSLLACVS